MKINKITQRWLVNNFVVILIMLIVIDIFVSLGIKNFYYSSVEKFIKSQAISVMNLLESSYNDRLSDTDYEVRTIVENFKQRNKMEMMLLSSDGKVLMNSSGFLTDEKIDTADYKMIKRLEENTANTGRYAQVVYPVGSNNVMAITYPVEARIKDISYVRFVSVITDVDRQVIIMIALVVLVSIFVIFFVVVSSSYFVQSIVVPVEEISKTAKQIAQGNFNIRLKKKTDDEIGDLCETINYMAEELSTTEKMKNEFISSISHELRTPLTAIKGWAETVDSCGPGDGELVSKGMRVIIGESERLASMVEELLDFSRMQSGKVKLELAPINVVSVIRDIVVVFQERAKKENIELSLEILDDVIMVSGDRNRLKQVFTNIIDNAFKYSGDSGKVDVICERREKFVVIKVVDFGCGINAKELPRIKKKFYKANYTKRGSGIGLAVADEIIGLHNGSLDVYSEENKGTTVIIQLPLLEQ